MPRPTYGAKIIPSSKSAAFLVDDTGVYIYGLTSGILLKKLTFIFDLFQSNKAVDVFEDFLCFGGEPAGDLHLLPID
ncbi:MAG: hypothetical protein COB42_06045 [Sulfurimonas sp.]|nr:MAG: hypothetical protein COB42_06045 [Sulfurimonas sp.]